jgi:hypothetical protein
METTIEGTPHITLADAAELLATTHLRVLMLLKHRVVTGSMVDGEWYVDKSSLDCLKRHGISPPDQASCRTSCTASACGCAGE